MTPGSVVVEFPSGRPVGRGTTTDRRRRNVAGIVGSLSGRRPPPSATEHDQPLSINLSDIAGIADDTVRRLRSLALAGIITPASACRLALRHADEVGGARAKQLPARGTIRYELALAGDPFGAFACHLRGRSGWIVFAPTTGLGLLAEVCPDVGIKACLLIGVGADGRSTLRVTTAKDWRRRISALASGNSRCGPHHVLLLGGPPSRELRHSSILAEIERAVRRNGQTRLVRSISGERLDVGRTVSSEASMRDMLSMIELAFPGLLDVPAAVDGGRR
nr:hypothetical protein [Methylobacterium sp. L1A1]